jgi:competence protein ComEC
VRENVREGLAVPFLARGGPAVSALVADWISAEQGRFLPWLPVFMAAGNLSFFSADHMPPAWVAYAAVLAAVAVLALAWRSFLGRPAGLCLCAAALGFAAASIRTHDLPPMPDLPRRAVVVEGRVAAVDPLPTGRRVLLAQVTIHTDGEAQGEALQRRLRIRLRNTDSQPIAPGDRLRLRALLRPPYAPSYPGGWDQRRDAYFQNLGGVGFALGQAKMLSAAKRLGLAGWWQHTREGIATRVMSVVPGSAGAVAATLLTGLNTAIPQADRGAFATAGLAHILAVAGLHIGIVMSTVFVGTRFALAHWPWVALRFPIKQIAGVAAIALGGFYMAVTGMHLPIMRSFVMASLVTIGLIAGRQAISMRSLALAAAVLLVLQPEALAGVSFQMSFGAVLVLIAGYEALRSRRLVLLAHQSGIWSWLRRDLLLVTITSLLAALATAPFVAYHFGQIQPYSVFANMLAVPLAAFWVLPWGLGVYALMPLHLECLALIPMGWGCSLMLGIARGVAALPAADVAVPQGPLWGLGLAGFSLVWLCLWQSRLRLLGLPPLLIAVFLLPLLAPTPDILVSPDARLIAFREARAIYLVSATKDDFTLGEWRRFFGGRPVLPLGGGSSGTPPRAPGIACTPAGCLLPAPQLRPPHLLYWRAEQAPGRCNGISFIVTTDFWDAGAPGACAGTPFVDRSLLRRGGAVAVFLAGTPVIKTDRSGRGDWPWLPSATQ